MTRSRLLWALSVSVIAGACAIEAVGQSSQSAPVALPDGVDRVILYLAPAPENDPAYLPAFRGAQVALAVSGVPGERAEIIWVEVPGELEGWEPPRSDAAMVAPGAPERFTAGLGEVLFVPTVTFSDGGESGWKRLIADARDLESRLRRFAGSDGCVVEHHVGGNAPGYVSTDSLTGTRIRIGDILREPRSVAGCSALLWTGGGGGAARLIGFLSENYGDAIALIGTDAMRDGTLETGAEPVAPTFVVSAASDVSTDVALETRRFVQDYQSEVGSPPGPFSVEGWDAVGLILGMLRGNGMWPEVYRGVAHRYDLAAGADRPTHIYRLTSTGWRVA